MKSGTKLGAKINRKPGKTGERYILLERTKNKPYKIQVTSHIKPSRHITVGYAHSLEDAVEMRDKYLESL